MFTNLLHKKNVETLLKKKMLLVLAFVAIFFATRVPGLATDAINPDAVNWHARTEQFVVGLKYAQFEKTYQHYHPGVTLMWIIGIPTEIFKQISPQNFIYSHVNFLTFHFISKFTLIITQLVLSVFIIYLLAHALRVSRISRPFLKSLFITSLFSFEIFFLGNSRLLHMDILLSLFVFIALIFSYLAIRDFKNIYVFGAGTFWALSFLTKSISIGGILYSLIVGGFIIHSKYGTNRGLSHFLKSKLSINKKLISYKLLLLGSFFVVLFVLFPALWRDPVGVFVKIFDEAERVGIRKGHKHIFFGNVTNDPGIFFYPLVFLIKLTPFTLFGVISYIILYLKGAQNSVKKAIEYNNLVLALSQKLYNSPLWFFTLFYVGYIFTMTYPAKKLDRYMLPVFPLLAMFAVFGYFGFYNLAQKKLKKTYTFVVALMFIAFILLPILTKFPYYFTYTSPLFLTSQTANKIIAQKPFGIGTYELRQHIFETYSEKYGQFPRLGLFDTKPMRSIYQNSKIVDARFSDTDDLDLLILAINEEIPVNIKDVFTKDSSVFINGLEYYRIYVKNDSK